MTYNFKGKTAVVTGASRGIGEAIARTLAADGAKVALVARSADKLKALAAELPNGAIAIEADMSSSDGWRKAADGALAALGEIDVLVNNAGVSAPTAPVEGVSLADWRECLEICLDAQFLGAKRVAPLMKAQKSGAIINLSSNAGQHGFGNRTPYAAAKWGVIGLTKSLAQEFAGRGLTANVVAPGFIETDMTAALTQEIRDGMLKTIPLSRFGAPDDIAKTVVFLCGDGASYITGQTLVVDGGMTM